MTYQSIVKIQTHTYLTRTWRTFVIQWSTGQGPKWRRCQRRLIIAARPRMAPLPSKEQGAKERPRGVHRPSLPQERWKWIERSSVQQRTKVLRPFPSLPPSTIQAVLGPSLHVYQPLSRVFCAVVFQCRPVGLFSFGGIYFLFWDRLCDNAVLSLSKRLKPEWRWSCSRLNMDSVKT